jgi:hypothetical protein
MGQLVDFLYHTTKWVKPIHYPLYFFGHVGQRLGRPILTDLHPAVLPLWVLSSEVTDRPTRTQPKHNNRIHRRYSLARVPPAASIFAAAPTDSVGFNSTGVSPPSSSPPLPLGSRLFCSVALRVGCSNLTKWFVRVVDLRNCPMVVVAHSILFNPTPENSSFLCIRLHDQQ